MKIPIAIVDDIPANRALLADQIAYSNEVEVCLTAKNGIDFLKQMEQMEPAVRPLVVLMDIEMPEMEGTEAVKIAHQFYPDLKFLMLTVFDDEDKIFEAIKNGANGYLLKDERTSTIIDYIKQLIEVGGAPMSPSIARKALSLLSKATFTEGEKIKDNVSERLSERECDVLKLVVEGKDSKVIADKLFLSVHTIRKHIANIYEKLHVNSKAQVISLAIHSRWFS